MITKPASPSERTESLRILLFLQPFSRKPFPPGLQTMLVIVYADNGNANRTGNSLLLLGRTVHTSSVDTIKKGYQTLQRPFPQLHAFYGQWVFFSSRLLSLLYCNRLNKFGLFPAGAALLHRGVQKALGHGTDQYMVLGDYSSPILHLFNNCIFYTA